MNTTPLISALKAALDAATPGPWVVSPGGRYGAVASTDPEAIARFAAKWPDSDKEVAAYGGKLVGESIEAVDRNCIVLMHEAVPALIECAELFAYVRDNLSDYQPGLWANVDQALEKVGL